MVLREMEARSSQKAVEANQPISAPMDTVPNFSTGQAGFSFCFLAPACLGTAGNKQGTLLTQA